MPDGCPPAQAILGPKRLFRLVRNEVFDESDFMTTREENKFKNGDPCRRCSISVLENENAARIMRKAIPNLAHTKIACGIVPQGAGKVMHTPSHASQFHWSWWPTDDIVRSAYFELLHEAA